MSRYLLTVKSTAPLDALRALPVPADYLVEAQDQSEGAAADGLEHWDVDLQLAGSLADWVKAPAYGAFWSYVQTALAPAELRPRASLRIRSRFDPHSVSVAIAYLGDHELKRAAEGVRQRLEAAVEPKSKKMKADLALSF